MQGVKIILRHNVLGQKSQINLTHFKLKHFVLDKKRLIITAVSVTGDKGGGHMPPTQIGNTLPRIC